MIKAVIFDCFGVLVQGSLGNFVDLYLSHDKELVRKAYDVNNQCSLGYVTYEEQIQEFADMAGISKEKTHSLMDNNPRNTALLEYIRENLKPHYKIGFLSNAGANLMDELFEQRDIELFDDAVLSYEHNVVKPDKEIYELSAKRLGVELGECVFIDDIHAYVVGARDTGMQAIQYKNLTDFKDKLQDILS